MDEGPYIEEGSMTLNYMATFTGAAGPQNLPMVENTDGCSF
jgi:hypothetical protein